MFKRLKTPLSLVLFLLLIIASYFLFQKPTTYAQECPSSDYDCQIAQIQREYDALAKAHGKNKEDLAALQKQLADLNKRITSISTQLKNLRAEIAQREEDLAFVQEIFEEKASNHYKFLRLYDPFLPFLSTSASEAFREITFRQKAADEDRKIMEGYAMDLIELKNDKAALEKSQASLAAVQKSVSEKEKFLSGEVAKVETYLVSLSSKQNELAALKAGGFQTTVGDIPPTLEPCSGKPGSSNFCDPGFRPAFAAFSYGAPHRKGMSQYGAYGRAKAGKSAEEILNAYYGGIQLNKGYSTSINITVSGYGTVDIETYVKRIYEMPSSWMANDSAALKAQAVAARSYALAYTNNGSKPICATESCQVYKPANKGGAWDAAVDATRGWVLVSGGAPFSAWYASTAGGYTFSYSSAGHSTPNLWDTPSGKDGWPNSAYEVVGASPWFYKGWYKSRGGASCGRGNPWLNSEEMADILNAEAVLHGRASGDKSRVSPIDCWGGNPYSMGELRGIGGYTSVSGVSIVYGNDGSTISVNFSTNKAGGVNLTG